MADDSERDFGSSIFPKENNDDLVENNIWIQEAVKKLQLEILPKLKKAEHEFLSAAAKEKNIKIHELLKQAEEDCIKRLIEEDNESIKRQIDSVQYRFIKPEEYWEKAREYVAKSLSGNSPNIDAPDDDFFTIVNSLSLAEQQRKNQKERMQKQFQNNKEYLTKYQIYLSLSYNHNIVRLFSEWMEYWGDKNAIYFAAMKKGIPVERLESEMQQKTYSFEDAKIGKRVREGGRKGAKTASIQSKKEERMRKAVELYYEYKAKYKNYRELVIINMVADEIEVSNSTVYRYLKSMKK
ncbi:MAG: hypothetical protein BWX81_00223 [Spirochaetes bacterium ADurb.Bin110]|jgi:hypothetical protein|nr:MAG: hypothetical protein BWX81_00223 [Spirochaetes bacterium ADurb.Bin110]